MEKELLDNADENRVSEPKYDISSKQQVRWRLFYLS